MTAQIPIGPNDVNLEDFMEELAQTGVSCRFLEEARPRIARAFSEVLPQNRAECLEAIRITIRTQAETEAGLKLSMDQVERLVKAEAELADKLRLLKTNAKSAAESAAAAAFGLLRLSNPPADMN
jgi:hypothetical protein